MSHPEYEKLDALGRDIAQLQDARREARSDEMKTADLQQFLAACETGETARETLFSLFFRPIPVMAAFAVLIVAVGVVYMVSRKDLPEYRMNGVPGTVGERIRVSDRGADLADFSDGSRVWFNRGTEAAVTSVDENGAVVRIRSGSAYVKVVHRENTRWIVMAGPFTVNVTGTAFLVSWNARANQFELRMDEGRVLVDGPNMETPRSLSGKERLEVRVSEPQPEERDTQSDNAQSSSVSHKAGARTEPRATSQKSPNRPEKADTWISLAAQRRYVESLQLANVAGFSKLCSTLSMAELQQLADVARFARDSARETEALNAIRARFAGTRAATTAAYMLGNTAFQNRQYRVAEKWNLTYLQEAPGGPLAEEALGRVMEIQHEQGRGADARVTAEQYLRKYPGGNRVKLATFLTK